MTLPLTDSEIEYVKRIARPFYRRQEKGAPAKGIMVGMLVGTVLWVVIGIVIYFTCFSWR